MLVSRENDEILARHNGQMNNLLPGEYDVQRWGQARKC